jgi:hypothetical protein
LFKDYIKEKAEEVGFDYLKDEEDEEKSQEEEDDE